MILKKVYRKLENTASVRGIGLLFLLAHSIFGLMMLFTFPRINAKFGTKAFDLKTFGYTKEEAVQMIQGLDTSTVDFYLFPQLFFLDVLYPILLALFLSALIIRLSKLIQIKSNSVYDNLYILPFIAMGFDYLENIFISIMITGTSTLSEGLVKMASICTQLKGIFTTLSWIVILILLVLWLVNKWKNKMTTSKNPYMQ